MATIFSPSWERYFGRAPAAASAPVSTARPPFRHVLLVATDAPAPAGAGAPPRRPTLVDQRPTPPEPPRRPRELAWLTWQMPALSQEAVLLNLRQTLAWRAQYCQPLPEPAEPVERTRFGLLGEQLCSQGVSQVRRHLRAELREALRTLEGSQPRLVRNRRLAMHSVRLGQVCQELAQRGLNALEEVRAGLALLWE